MGIRSRSSVREIRGGGGPVRFPRRLARRQRASSAAVICSNHRSRLRQTFLFYSPILTLDRCFPFPVYRPTPAPRPDNSMKSFRSSFPFSLSLFFFLYPTIFNDARRSRRYKCGGKFYPFLYPSTWEKFFERILGS